MDIAIVTDSTGDIPPELAAQHHIQVVPNLLVINGKSIEDGKGISREEFYNRLPGMNPLPTTATASSGTYHQLYEKLFQLGCKEILSIHASGLLSGIVNSASLAAQSFAGRVHVIDSTSVTLGLGFQVLAAAEAVAHGAGLDATLALLKDLHPRSRVVAMLDTLEYVRRSGRVSWARANLGNLLRIKPFVEMHAGKVRSLGETRTRHKGIDHLKELLLSQGPLERLAILHTNAEAEARQIVADLNLQMATEPLVVNVTTIIGTHTGPNGLGFAAIVKE